jgi:hypothetical protein
MHTDNFTFILQAKQQLTQLSTSKLQHKQFLSCQSALNTNVTWDPCKDIISCNFLNKCRPLYFWITMDPTLYVSLFLPYSFFIFFLSLYQRRRWVEEGRREVPSTVICNQGNGQYLSHCQTVAPTREAPMNTSLVVLYCSNVAATWTLIAKEPFRFQASPCTIRGRPNHTTMYLSPSTSVPPPLSTNTPYSYLIHLPGDGQRSHKRPLIQRHTLISWRQWSQLQNVLCVIEWVTRLAMVARCTRNVPSSC